MPIVCTQDFCVIVTILGNKAKLNSKFLVYSVLEPAVGYLTTIHLTPSRELTQPWCEPSP